MGATLALGGSINSVKICSEYLFFFCEQFCMLFHITSGDITISVNWMRRLRFHELKIVS